MPNIMTDSRRVFFQDFINQVLKDPRKFERFLHETTQGKDPSYKIKSEIPGYVSINKTSATALLHSRITGDYLALEIKQELAMARIDAMSFSLKTGQNPAVDTTILLDEIPGKRVLRIHAIPKAK